ncbi:ABC transporter ATP-binding protein [Chloroflexi bacterium TSY]|nr:ABC transporter ATP-binding protein [Chloroflexi bacterium TSY]
MSNAINLHNLTKTYSRRRSEPVCAVSTLNLSIPSGQVIGFLGPNGAGKTTTIKMMCGLVEPTAGSITLNGFDVSKQRGHAMQQIGAVLEGTRNVYWRLTAWQNLIYFGRLKGFWGRQLRRRAEKLLRELDLWERRSDPVRDFSRGMQQKVAIACALIADPPIVLLDEPTLGLDVHASRVVREWVEQLASERGKTIVLTTHQLHMAQELCDRVVIIHHGQVIADQPTGELLDLFRQERYEICIEAEADDLSRLQTEPQFQNLSFVQENGYVTLSCPITHQNTLHQMLDVIRRQNLTLLSLQRAEPKLEEVFVQLTKGSQ